LRELTVAQSETAVPIVALTQACVPALEPAGVQAHRHRSNARERLADGVGSGMSLQVALQAFAAAVVIGSLIALVFVQSRLIEKSPPPLAVLLQVTPIVAIAPLIVISSRVLRRR
jgi:ABC-type nitrate/sulfonate/bicarbonate transport system permease component